MNPLRLIPPPAALAAVLLASCSTVSVKTDADPRANFAKYRSYSLSEKPVSGSRRLSPSSFATLRSSLDAGLSAKGLRKSSKPSLVIVYHVAARNRTEIFMVPNWSFYGGFGYGYYGYWTGFIPSMPMVSQFTEGSLILDFVDTATKRLVWRGTAIGMLGSQKENQESIAEAVRKMLEDFPPKR